MLLNDRQIGEQKAMIKPYFGQLIREYYGVKTISFGQSSYGYDIRLSPTDFRIFGRVINATIDPKNFDERVLEHISPESSENGEFFTLPPFCYALGCSVEQFQMPPNVTGICNGKSTYARVGLIVNITPLEAGWNGYLTLEFFNATPYSMKLYANEGVAQILFFTGEPCLTSYSDRAGKYQGQEAKVVTARL